MNDPDKKSRMTVAEFFTALESAEDFIYSVAITGSFKKNVRLCHKQNLDLKELYHVIESLAKTETLPPKNHIHHLTGYGKERENEKYMECHIAPDWILIWVQKDDEMILVFTNTGTHSDLF